MASRHCVNHFQDDDLKALQAALEDVVATLKAHNPYRNWDADKELKTRIAERLLALASVGINTPKDLRRRALQTLSLYRGMQRQQPAAP